MRTGLQVLILSLVASMLPLNSQVLQRASQGWWQQEDARLRANVVPLPYGIEEVLRMKPYRFDEQLSTGERVPNIGLMAQEIASVLPEAVREPSGSCTAWTIDYSRVVTVLVAAIQQQQRQIEELRATIESLRSSAQPTAGSPALSARVEDDWLGDNIPNPHDGTTSIAYYIPNSVGRAELVVSDLAGRRLRAIVLPARGYWATVTLDMSMLSAGTYEYSLAFDGRIVATKRMQLLR